MTAHILVIDEDPAQRRNLKAIVEGRGYVAHVTDNAAEGVELLRRYRDEINAVIVDAAAPEGLPPHLIGVIADINPAIQVIVQAAEGVMDEAIAALRAGAFEFLVKPFTPERLSSAIMSALKVNQSSQHGRLPRRSRTSAVGFSDLITASASMTRVVELARRAAQSTIPVMLEGEPGVGKELVARAIHASSERASRPFVSLNCGATAHGLLEPALFGHGGVESGRPTGVGKFMEADGGTLFLEDISEISLDVQARLLKVVQSSELENGPGRRPRRLNVRLILATNKDLIAEVKAGRFREDLYYRLNVFPITMAALRRRKEDIPHLVRAFVERFAHEQRLGRTPQLDRSAMALLTSFDWPGNVRQLENAVFRAVVLSDGAVLKEADFPQIVAQLAGPRKDVVSGDEVASGFDPAAGMRMSASVAERLAALQPQAQTSSQSQNTEVSGAPANVIVSTDEAGNVRKLAEIEEELIRFALKFYRGQMSQVARKLGIGRSTLYRKLKDYGIDPDDPQKDAA
ncbi:sigma-54-dependent Fis family transcriptional regulator [Peteryoungia desertarenae]|uniref:DNA-binding transcriptional regulator NtrC n=1 Tax=Peteryoungia desertarenae TaxID=1813451 RepID=A0ABX6QIN3_9HYPH|nr:sigma-54 dependent transcriptional regulator [Peteryoungia desertarenae]QLF68100.1 sigma-54-dependent Fis family transcriptional regulator [Peteryoungia desertarenae]